MRCKCPQCNLGQNQNKGSDDKNDTTKKIPSVLKSSEYDNINSQVSSQLAEKTAVPHSHIQNRITMDVSIDFNKKGFIVWFRQLQKDNMCCPVWCANHLIIGGFIWLREHKSHTSRVLCDSTQHDPPQSVIIMNLTTFRGTISDNNMIKFLRPKRK